MQPSSVPRPPDASGASIGDPTLRNPRAPAGWSCLFDDRNLARIAGPHGREARFDAAPYSASAFLKCAI